MPAFDLVVTSTRVVTPDGMRPAALVVAEGTIRAVVEPAAAPDAKRRLDAGDRAVLPGVVDTHVHFNEPGRTEWEGFETGTRAAAAGGVTTIVEMPLNSIPVTTSVAALETKREAVRGKASVDYGFWGGVVPGNEDQLAGLVRAGVLGFKAFLVPSGIDEFPGVAEPELRPAMARLAELKSVLLVHAEMPGPIARAATAGVEPRRYATWLASRPRAAEHDAIDLVIRLARETGCAVHIVHLSSADALPALQGARSAGVPLTVETCPHYLTFGAESIPDGATAYKCAPPVREDENRERLWSGLFAGTIDLVASDHSPAPPDLKQLDTGDFVHAWGGIASVEVSLPALWTGAKSRNRTLVDMARWMAEGPAHLAGLQRSKGKLAPGYDADFVVFDAEQQFTVDPSRLHHRHRVTPYAGRRLSGVVHQTFLRGMCVYDDGTFPTSPQGRDVTTLRRRVTVRRNDG